MFVFYHLHKINVNSDILWSATLFMPFWRSTLFTNCSGLLFQVCSLQQSETCIQCLYIQQQPITGREDAESGVILQTDFFFQRVYSTSSSATVAEWVPPRLHVAKKRTRQCVKGGGILWARWTTDHINSSPMCRPVDGCDHKVKINILGPYML